MGKEGCFVEKALNIIGGKWSTLIIRDLIKGTKRYSELRKSLDGISPKSLTKSLRNLEYHSVISRKVYAEVPPRVEYKLTDYGYKLKEVIDSLAHWGSIEPPKITTTTQ